MELIDSAGAWGRTWTVARQNRRIAHVSATTAEARGGVLVFRDEDGALVTAFGPGEWLSLDRRLDPDSGVPDGAQVFERSR